MGRGPAVGEGSDFFDDFGWLFSPVKGGLFVEPVLNDFNGFRSFDDEGGLVEGRASVSTYLQRPFFRLGAVLRAL